MSNTPHHFLLFPSDALGIRAWLAAARTRSTQLAPSAWHYGCFYPFLAARCEFSGPLNVLVQPTVQTLRSLSPFVSLVIGTAGFGGSY